MPKKMGVNSKAEDARARKAEADAEKRGKEAKQKEEAYWREAEGPKSKAGKRREEEAEKRAEAMAKKAEARRLAELEEKELESYGKKVDKKANRVAVPKVTAAELARQREMEKQRLEAAAAAATRKEARLTAEDEYERMVVVENLNRNEDVIEARSVDQALAQMVIENLPHDRHPEKRAKASYKAFEEAELAKLKVEKPGLTLNQYKDLIWKLWKKSPDNPMNREA